MFFFRGGRGDAYQRVARIVTFIWKHTFARIGEDWVFLGLLGVIMALVSFLMDYTISMCNNARLWLVKDLVSNVGLQFLAWTSLPVFLVLFSAGFVHVVAPQVDFDFFISFSPFPRVFVVFFIYLSPPSHAFCRIFFIYPPFPCVMIIFASLPATFCYQFLIICPHFLFFEVGHLFIYFISAKVPCE